MAKSREGSHRKQHYDRGNHGGIGERTLIRKSLNNVMKRAPEALMEVLQDPEWQQLWLDAYQARLSHGARDAVRMYPELLKMIGPEKQITVVLHERFGVKSEEELERLVSRVREADQMTDDQRFERTCEWLRGYLVRNPERLEYARDYVLGQHMRVDDAQVVEESVRGEAVPGADGGV